jgi:hypothetical protein
MKSSILIIGMYLLAIMDSCFCSDGPFTTTFVTVESVRGLFHSYNENGIYPYLEHFNRKELGIYVRPDSTSEQVQIAQTLSFIQGAYACEDPSKYYSTNSIDSVHIYTRYDFDSNHPSGSLINDILLPIDPLDEIITGVNIEDLAFYSQSFRFSAIPSSDSMQFVIVGRILGKGDFETQTELVVLNE